MRPAARTLNTLPDRYDGIRRALLTWYFKVRRNLPWRSTSDPYKIWISEVMLQQTQVKTVIPYFQRFCERFPTVGELARADLQAVLKVWEGLGYYSRARNLHRAAQIVHQTLKGRIPEDLRRFVALPGVGAYTAAAVMSIAFGQPFAAVDGNVKRVLSRLFLMRAPVNQTGTHAVFQNRAQQLLAVDQPGEFNQALMELGALVCLPKSPRCDQCPLNQFCPAFGRNVVSNYPARIKKQTAPQQQWVSAVIRKKGRVLLVRRPPNGLLGGLWEFPCYSVTQKEISGADVLERIRSLTGLEASLRDKIVSVRHAYTHFKIRLDIYLCDWIKGRVRLDGAFAGQWAAPGQFDTYPMHRAVQKALPHIRRLLS